MSTVISVSAGSLWDQECDAVVNVVDMMLRPDSLSLDNSLKSSGRMNVDLMYNSIRQGKKFPVPIPSFTEFYLSDHPLHWRGLFGRWGVQMEYFSVILHMTLPRGDGISVMEEEQRKQFKKVISETINKAALLGCKTIVSLTLLASD